ncbi:MAG TPA: Gmad2 immunoglobulin-like domain-containing protein [Acidothermaceae bacterium]|nr:Gmad2 immunoglobulin-like domain-containing protein [Acidothermaceae bacterium]
MSVYLLSNGYIAASHRVVLGPAVARAAVQALLAGPTANDTAFGYTSKVPSNLQLSGLTISDGTARLSLTGHGFVPAAGLAQLVCTLTQFSSVDRAEVNLNGDALTIPPAGASLTRADIEAMLPVVLVESPTVGETVRTPLRVVGSANTFEAVFRLELTDWDGRIVATVVAHAASGTGTRGAFDVTIPYEVERAGIGELIASYDSPKDGSRIVVAEIPLHVGQ